MLHQAKRSSASYGFASIYGVLCAPPLRLALGGDGDGDGDEQRRSEARMGVDLRAHSVALLAIQRNRAINASGMNMNAAASRISSSVVDSFSLFVIAR